MINASSSVFSMVTGIDHNLRQHACMRAHIIYIIMIKYYINCKVCMAGLVSRMLGDEWQKRYAISR